MYFNHCLLDSPHPLIDRLHSYTELKKGKPVCSHGFRLTSKDGEQVEVQIKDYLDKEWITPSLPP